jgi:rod shape determining protein RodA
MSKKLRELDFPLLFIVLVLTFTGILLIYSSSPGKELWKKQLIWGIFSIILLFLILFLNIKSIIFYSPIFFILSIIPLFYLIFFGKKIAGSKSWIDFGYFSIQPSEFVKITTALFLSKIISNFKKDSLTFQNLFIIFIITFIPIFLIFLQPDYGTALIFAFLLFASIFIGGIRISTVILLTVILLISGFFLWEYILKEYHKSRIIAIFFPEFDPEGGSYQPLQSKIAIGSGGLLGKGFLKGTQTKAGFLPASSTDFILASAGEEFGFLGIFLILSLYLLLFMRIFKIIEDIEDKGVLVFVFLTFSLIFFQFFLNVSMVLGFFPVIGIPLPFLSYGGSSLLSLYLGIGLILNGKIRGKIEK